MTARRTFPIIRLILSLVVALLLAGGSLFIPGVRGRVRAIVRPEPPAQLTPLAISVPAPRSSPPQRATVAPTRTSAPARTSAAVSAAATIPPTDPAPTATSTPTPVPSSGPVEVSGRVYDAYIPAATKPGQFFQYSCEFDAAWVILKTYGIDATADELTGGIAYDTRVEPYIKQTKDGFLIYGGDIERAYSGDYKKSFLARSTGSAMRQIFDRYGLKSTLVNDRPALEAALRAGQLVWIKTTVDFKPWRPATWITPDGRRFKTVLGNDHAVVVMGFSDRGVVIRDVLGPTSTNRQRPYQYEVDWQTFLAAWGAQANDGLAVAPPDVR